MKFNRKITISLFSFVKQGKFNVLKTGQTRGWVLDNFPNPDGFEEGDNWRNGEFEIFSYGDFELHFSYDVLYLIFADYQGKIDAGDSLLFTQKWLFEKDTSALNLPFVIKGLKKEKISFEIEKNSKLHAITLHLESKVALHFESDESEELLDYLFVAFWLSDKSLLQKGSAESKN